MKVQINDRVYTLIILLIIFVLSKGAFIFFAVLSLTIVISTDFIELQINRKKRKKKKKILNLAVYLVLCALLIYCFSQVMPEKRLPFLGLSFAVALPVAILNVILYKNK